MTESMKQSLTKYLSEKWIQHSNRCVVISRVKCLLSGDSTQVKYYWEIVKRSHTSPESGYHHEFLHLEESEGTFEIYKIKSIDEARARELRIMELLEKK